MLPAQWRKISTRKRWLAVHILRFYWFSFHPLIRPMFIAAVSMWFLPKQPIALPTAIGIGFAFETFIRLSELILRG